MRLVIAGSYYQFTRRYDRRFKYLAVLPDDLMGHKDTTLYLHGTYKRRPDYRHFAIRSYCDQHNILMILD